MFPEIWPNHQWQSLNNKTRHCSIPKDLVPLCGFKAPCAAAILSLFRAMQWPWPLRIHLCMGPWWEKNSVCKWQWLHCMCKSLCPVIHLLLTWKDPGSWFWVGCYNMGQGWSVLVLRGQSEHLNEGHRGKNVYQYFTLYWPYFKHVNRYLCDCFTIQ